MSLTWHILHFLVRIAMGIAFSLGLTSPRQVTSGFFRIHLWVVMGIAVLASLVAWSLGSQDSTPLPAVVTGTAVATAVASYLAASCWIYEARRSGRLLTALVTIMAGFLVVTTAAGPGDELSLQDWPEILGALSAGLLLGSMTTAMLLGHWYLNTPSMQLAPLKRLLLLLFAALALRMLICGSSLILELGQAEAWGIRTWSIISFRWLAGLVGTLVLTLLTWQTLKIPNTQSATGILYAAVIVTFLGELVSQLLGVDMHYPL